MPFVFDCRGRFVGAFAFARVRFLPLLGEQYGKRIGDHCRLARIDTFHGAPNQFSYGNCLHPIGI